MAADADPSFEVATVKPTASGLVHPPPQIGGRQLFLPGRTVKDLLMYAYGLQTQQVTGGPDWMSKQRFDIGGVPDVEGQPGAEQWCLMVQKLLASRFKVTLHHDKQEMSAYVLSVAKGVPKLTKNSRGEKMNLSLGVSKDIRLFATNAAMSDIVSMLGGVLLDRPVLDQTGLEGGFDFKLTFSTDGLRFGNAALPANDGSTPAPNLFTALQDLGLKLEPVKAPVDVIVIEHVEQPSEN
jgi:uncharacterized protein (TIGR03435 family)